MRGRVERERGAHRARCNRFLINELIGGRDTVGTIEMRGGAPLPTVQTRPNCGDPTHSVAVTRHLHVVITTVHVCLIANAGKGVSVFCGHNIA